MAATSKQKLTGIMNNLVYPNACICQYSEQVLPEQLSQIVPEELSKPCAYIQYSNNILLTAPTILH